MRIVVLLLTFFPAFVAAYDHTVHYYATLVALQHSVTEFSDEELKIVSFCSQLPDETKEYNAIGQYRKFAAEDFGAYWTWANADFGSDEMKQVVKESKSAREMISVQQLLHGLTGGTAADLLNTAELIATSLARDIAWNGSGPMDVNKLCAFGFAVHLLGDSLAHRQLGSGGLTEPGVMYETGSGHFRDGTEPDKVLKSATGLDGWSRFSKELPDSRGCDVQHESATDEDSRDARIRSFEAELKLKPNECAVLIIQVSEDLLSLKVAGITGEGGFHILNVNEYEQEQLESLLKEIGKDKTDSGETIGLVPSALDQTHLLKSMHLNLWADLKAADEKWFGGDAAAREAIFDRAPKWASTIIKPPEEHKNQACQAYVNQVFPELVPKACVPDCESVWGIYSAVAKGVFESNHSDRKPSLAKKDYIAPSIEDDPPACIDT